MKTIEELEAELETVTRERDLSLFAWECAGMTGRDAQGAMLELARQLEEARAEVEAITGERDELLVRVANQDAELRATREAYNEAQAEVAQDVHLACLDARRNEREMIAAWLSEEVYRLPVYQPSYGPKELRARSRALEGAACAVRSCAHVPQVEDDDD